MSEKKKSEYRFYQVGDDEDGTEDELVAVIKCDFLTDGDAWTINAVLEERLKKPVVWY